MNSLTAALAESIVIDVMGVDGKRCCKVKMGWSCLDEDVLMRRRKMGGTSTESLFVRLRGEELSAVLTSSVSLCKAVTRCDD